MGRGLLTNAVSSSLAGFLLTGKQRIRRRRQLVASLEEVQLENENETEERAAEFLHERARSTCRAT